MQSKPCLIAQSVTYLVTNLIRYRKVRAVQKTSWTHCIDILIQFWPSPAEEDVIRMLLELEEQLIIDEDFIIEEDDGIAGTQ